MQKHYYLLMALVFFALASLCVFVVRKSEVGSGPKFVLEKIVSNAFLLAAIILLLTWGVRLLQ